MPDTDNHIAGVILCGGHSRRMGTPKPWLQCGSHKLLQHMVRIVGARTDPVIVANRPGNHIPTLPDNVQVVSDHCPDGGPLAGILAGLDALAGRSTAAFVIACDHPLLKPEFVGRLITLLGGNPAVVPEVHGRLQPLAAIYRLETRSIAADMLDAGDLRAETFARRCSPRIVRPRDLAQCDPELASLANCNDLDTFNDLVARPHTQRRPSNALLSRLGDTWLPASGDQ